MVSHNSVTGTQCSFAIFSTVSITGQACACGSERYRMQVRPAAVDLICEDCGAKLRIGAATDEDLDRLCCRMTLQIPGKKG